MAWVISRDDASSTTVAPRSRSRREKMLRRGSRTSRAKNATTPRKNGGRTAVAAGVAGSERDARDGSCPGREEEANGDEGSDCERDPGGWFGGGEGAVFVGRLPGTSDANADADATFFARSRGEASRAAVTIAASRRYGSSSGFPSGARVRATPSSHELRSRRRRNAARRSRSFRAISSREAPRRRRLDESVAILAEGRNSPVAIASGVVVNWRSGASPPWRRRRRAIRRRPPRRTPGGGRDGGCSACR